MQINLIADGSVGLAPAGFTAAVQAAANIYDQAFIGNYIVNIRYGWGTFDNETTSELSGPGAFSIGGPVNNTSVSYATVKSWLTADATLSDQKAAVASLPASNTAFPGDANSFYVSSAQEKALGEFTGKSSAVDGAIGFNTIYASDSFYWETAALCEIGHALGWMTEYYAGQPTILDLFRYASAGQYEWTGGQPAYFSINDGTTPLATFSTSFDYTLFTNVASNDPFNVAGDTNPAQALTSLDTEVLNVIGFGAQPYSDLEAYVALSSSKVAAGSGLAISLYDLNMGTAAAGASTTALYLSTNPTIASDDTLLTTTNVGVLTAYPASGYYDHQNLSVTLPGNLAPGTYYIGAIANSNGQVNESGAQDTTYDDVVPITVTAPPEPDLTAYVALSNTKVGAGGSLAVGLYDINLGNGAAGASTTALYLSTSPTVNSSDTLLTTTNVGALTAFPASGYYDLQNLSVTLPGNLTPGTYYIGAIANSNRQVTESNTSNNTDDVVPITVTAPPEPDLTAYVALSNTKVGAGGSLAVSLYDINLGNGAAGASTTALYLSTSPTINSSHTLLTTTSVGPLAPLGASGYYDLQKLSVTLPGNLTPGTYYIGAIANSNGQVTESNASNNTDDVVSITITQPPQPHLEAYITLNSSAAVAGANLTVSLYDLDLGTAAAGASTTAIYLSANSTISSSDTLLTTTNVGALTAYPASGYYDHQNLSVTLPVNLTPGTYYVGAIADSNGHVTESGVGDTSYDNVVPITIVAPQGNSFGDDDSAGDTLNGASTQTAAIALNVPTETVIEPGTTPELTSAYSGAIEFAGATGTLKLDNSSSFTGTVAGMTDQDTIDFADIDFATVHTPSFSGSSAGGTLTVTDGTLTANIALLGNYMASAFVASSDGHGGTNVIDPQLSSSSNVTAMTQPHA